MQKLINGCAITALLLGLSAQARAEIVVRDAPIHAVPADAGDQALAEGPAAAEPAAVKALIQPKAPPEPVLTPDETAFFAVLGKRVTDAASAYESYVRRVGAIDPAFSGAAAVQRAVTAGAAYQPRQLEEGIIAYAALVALRDQAFVDGVRAVQNPAFADGLAASPERIMQVRGAADAAADVAGVLRAQGAALTAAGKAITKAAYDIQSQAWSKTPVQDPQGVLSAAKAAGEQRLAATDPSKEKLLASLVAAPQSEGSAAAPASDVVRGLALAALAILGRTGDGAEAQYEALLRDVSSEDCLKMVKLNLNQCLAVAGPHYEDVYCAGRHAVSDTGQCVTQAASRETTPDAAPPPLAPRTEEARIPGPEESEAYGLAAPAAPGETYAVQAEAPAQLQAPAQIQAPAQTLAQAQPQPRPYSYAQNDYVAPPPAPQSYAPQGYAPQTYPAPAYPPQAYARPAPQAAPPQAAYPQTGYAQAPYPAQTYPGYNTPQYPTQPASQPLYQSAPYPQQAYPQQAYAQQAYPQQPYPQQGYAPQTYPQQQSYAPQAYPQPQGYYPR